MELLLNELSINGQFPTVQKFVEDGIPPLVSVLNEVDKSTDLLYKKHDFYASMVTPHTNLHTVFIGHDSRKYDVIRKFKSLLASLFENPYWEDNAKHSQDDTYNLNNVNISGTSIAEACERDKVIISFKSDSYNAKALSIEKVEEVILVDNLFDTGHYSDLAIARGLVIPFSLTDPIRFARTNRVNQGQTVFREVQTGFYWYLDNLHKSHYEVFDAQEKHIGEADLEGNIDNTKRVNGRRL